MERPPPRGVDCWIPQCDVLWKASKSSFGADHEQRPARVRIDFLLHSIPEDVRDDDDYDGDSDVGESLAQAIFDQAQEDDDSVNTTQAVIEAFGYEAKQFVMEKKL